MQKSPEWLSLDLCPLCNRCTLDVKVWGEKCTNVECEYLYDFDDE